MKTYGIAALIIGVLLLLLLSGFRSLAAHTIVPDDAHKIPNGNVMTNTDMGI